MGAVQNFAKVERARVQTLSSGALTSVLTIRNETEKVETWETSRLVLIMLKILPIILFFYSQVISYHSLDTCLLF